MNIIALTDIHGRTGIFDPLAGQLRSADLVVLSGDITHFGHKDEIAAIIANLRKFNHNILAVTGNCDHHEVEQFLSDEGISVFGSMKPFKNIVFYGLSGSLPCPGPTPNEYSDQEYEAILADVHFSSDQPVIMISHQPPYNTLNDFVPPGIHVGSKSIRDFIARTRPLICFTGHIHEGIGIDTIGSTAIANPGPAFYGGYAKVVIDNNAVKSLTLQKFK
jgi:Icc-related predicted phosphoesterase